MFTRFTRFPLLAAPVLGLGVAGLAFASGQSELAGEAAALDPVRCEIQATVTNGMITLQGVLHAEVAIDGSYQFRVTSSGGGGSSNISQGGWFSAGPDGAVTLGQVMLGNSGATYDASLEITSDGKAIACADRVGGAI